MKTSICSVHLRLAGKGDSLNLDKWPISSYLSWGRHTQATPQVLYCLRGEGGSTDNHIVQTMYDFCLLWYRILIILKVQCFTQIN